MFRSRFAGQLAMLVLFAIAEAQASSKPSEAELAAITVRGVLLAEYDTAAWQATDAVQAAHAVKERVGRYIGRKTDAGWVVDFGRLNQAADKFLVAYEAVQVSAKFEVKSFDPAREDTGWNLAATKAIETAMRDLGGTSRPYNIAVLPADHESLYVYLYPAQVEAGVYPLGADVRYHVSRDGTKIIEKRQMHKTATESRVAHTLSCMYAPRSCYGQQNTLRGGECGINLLPQDSWLQDYMHRVEAIVLPRLIVDTSNLAVTPSPGPPRLKKTPAAVHPLPQGGEGRGVRRYYQQSGVAGR